jgi:SulP family sulfate permease
MDMSRNRARAGPHQPTFAELFTPKLITVLREGYGILPHLRDDMLVRL